VRAIYGQYTQDKAAPNVANYVTRMLNGFQNPNMTNIISLTNSFNPGWGVFLTEQTDGELKNAIDSICANRHLIAHGREPLVLFVMPFFFWLFMVSPCHRNNLCQSPKLLRLYIPFIG